jgi:phosphomannomutase
MITIIKFGTSGWRSKIGENFNVVNLRRIALATASHIKENKKYGYNGEEYEHYLLSQKRKKPNYPFVVVGYDTRFFSEYAAKIVSEVLTYNGIHVIFSDTHAPTPTVAYLVMKYGCVGGITITASHNPPEYNGYKWTPFWGGPATVEITSDLEARVISCGEVVEKYMSFDAAVSSKLIRVMDFHKDYFSQIENIIDFDVIKSSKITVVCDSVYGTARTYLKALLLKHGIKAIGIRENRDVYFGGRSPDTDEENLGQLREEVLKNKADIGVACDGDADRFGIITSSGKWLSPNLVIALLYYHLIKNKKMSGGAVRSVMTSHMIDVIANSYGFKVRETPVGFKYIGEMLRSGEFVIGGEESGGLSIRGHVPEKDGILACLLAVEMIAYEKKSLDRIIADLESKFGRFYTKRVNFKIDESVDVSNVVERLKKDPPLKIASYSVWRIDHTDGFKFILKNGAWLGLRPSGTEPVVRIYAEARDKLLLDKLVEEGKNIVIGESVRN